MASEESLIKPQVDARAQEFWAGVRGQLPILLGVVPFGLIFGVLAITADIPPLEAQAFSLIIFAGSSQFIAAGLVGDGVPPLLIVITIFAVNLRHALYSATLAPHWQALSGRWKTVLAWLLTDEAFATSIVRYSADDDKTHAHWYAFGTGLTLWTAWQLSTVAGIVLGTQVQQAADIGLDFALPLTFLALVFPMLVDRPMLLSAAAAGLSAVALADLPFRSGLLVAAIIGIAVGMLAEKMRPDWVQAKEDTK